MQAFLYVNLSAPGDYRNSLLNELKRVLPDLTMLDMDAGSGELLQHYALRLLNEAEQLVVCIKAQEEGNNIMILMPLLEALFQHQENRLVLLIGSHSRLQRIFTARPELPFRQVKEEEVVNTVQGFLKH